MKTFEYYDKLDELLTPNIVNMIALIHEYKGKQALYKKAKSDILETLIEIAKIQSADHSNRIEGIFTSVKLRRMAYR